MGAAEVISFEEVRARKQWDALRHQLHDRFDQWLDGQTWPTPPVTVDRRITPPTAASERSMIVSCHAAPQCADAGHAYQPGDTPRVPGSSRHGNVHVRLGGWYNVSSVGLHSYDQPP